MSGETNFIADVSTALNWNLDKNVWLKCENSGPAYLPLCAIKHFVADTGHSFSSSKPCIIISQLLPAILLESHTSSPILNSQKNAMRKTHLNMDAS